MILRLALLAPDIQQAILAGRQPPAFNLERFKKITVPLAWSEQREVLGFSDRAVPCSVEEQGNAHFRWVTLGICARKLQPESQIGARTACCGPQIRIFPVLPRLPGKPNRCRSP